MTARTISKVAVHEASDRMMKAASRYWRLIRLRASGQRQIDEIVTAKAFFQDRFAASDRADSDLQRQLWQFMQIDGGDDHPASLCLRCFISYQIDQVCLKLAAQFGSQHGFSREDLLPFVLDDPGATGRSPQTTASFALDVLQTFDPNRAGLATWVTQRVKHHRELNAFLLEQGVYMVSDWAILNDTKLPQLQRVLTEFHALTPAEVQEFAQVLRAYHQVYRQDRLNSLTVTKGRACAAPTQEQLDRMVVTLKGDVSPPPSPAAVMGQLRTLATYLRQYRIHARGGAVTTESLDQPELQATLAAPTHEADEQTEFLQRYRQEFSQCLDQALAQVVGDRLASFQRRKSTSPDQFLRGLHLFHCEGQSMGEMASELGLKAQYQVTRLLKLKEFRADVRQNLLRLLGDRIRELATAYADPAQIQIMESQIETVLTDHIDTFMQAAEAEASVARHQPLSSVFARRLCHHLKARRTES
ncbi:MAG: hypothetical protein VKK04_02645 [Synechococcales bacterium]|nr:hypothetical protein [Synechococcales bacterium]